MATVEKHAPRNYVAFKNIKICQRFQSFRKISKSSKNKKNFKERFEVFRAKQKSLRVHFSREELRELDVLRFNAEEEFEGEK